MYDIRVFITNHSFILIFFDEHPTCKGTKKQISAYNLHFKTVKIFLELLLKPKFKRLYQNITHAFFLLFNKLFLTLQVSFLS